VSKISVFFVTLVGLLIPILAQAYIGPGMGLGLAAMVLGIFIAFILLIVGLIWFPIRRILRQRKKNKVSNGNTPGTNL
jgi:nitrate reductase gamma subunit